MMNKEIRYKVSLIVVRWRDKAMTRLRTALHMLGAFCLVATRALEGQGTRLKLDTQRLGSRADTLAVFLIRGTDTVRTGAVVDEIRVEKERLIRVYSTTDRVLGNGLDTIISSRDGLRPIAYRTRSASRIARLSFRDLEITGWTRLPNGDSTEVRESLPAVVYDGASFDLIIRASPLRDGFSLAVPSFLIGPNTVGTLTGSVTGT